MSRLVEHQEYKAAAAEITQMADQALEHALKASREERDRIQAEAETAQT